MFIHKTKKYQMDTAMADTTLQSVFAACDKKPNEVPFDKILLRGKMTSKACNVNIILCVVLLIVTLLLPLTFQKPSTRVITGENKVFSLISHSVENNELILTFSETTFNADTCEMLLVSGSNLSESTFKPLQIDDDSDTIVFPYFEDAMSIYIEDISGSSMTILVTPR